MVKISQNKKKRVKQSNRKLEDETGKSHTALGLNPGSAHNMTLNFSEPACSSINSLNIQDYCEIMKQPAKVLSSAPFL